MSLDMLMNLIRFLHFKKIHAIFDNGVAFYYPYMH
jgi:hypothetical protein